jgi:ADP-ribose pyrophosphatase YjhB (NUDIX family)
MYGVGSLNQWVVDKRRGLWLTIPIEKSSFIPIAVKNGFIFHHAKHNQIVLTKWLPTDEPNKLPGYMTNYLGVGGFVLNDKNEVLVVKEKYFANPVWKLPGGMVDPLEDIGAAACREVMEGSRLILLPYGKATNRRSAECSVKAEFVSIIAFRHRHDALFEGSDMYFIARLKPLSEEIIFDKDEILEARWLPVEEYINDPSVTALNREIASMGTRPIYFSLFVRFAHTFLVASVAPPQRRRWLGQYRVCS